MQAPEPAGRCPGGYVEIVEASRGAEAHAVVTMNDPEKLNPLSAPLTVRVRERLTELAADESLLACDLILVSERARLVPAFGRIGLLPEVGTSWLLTRRLGYQRTFELFAGGRGLRAPSGAPRRSAPCRRASAPACRAARRA